MGLDVAHENNRLQAALSARDSGEATITGPIVLVHKTKNPRAFCFMHHSIKTVTLRLTMLASDVKTLLA